MGYKPVATAVSLQSFDPGQGIALIYKVPVHPGFIVITPGVVYIELWNIYEMMEISLKSQVLIGVFRERCIVPFQMP